MPFLFGGGGNLVYLCVFLHTCIHMYLRDGVKV